MYTSSSFPLPIDQIRLYSINTVIRSVRPALSRAYLDTDCHQDVGFPLDGLVRLLAWIDERYQLIKDRLWSCERGVGGVRGGAGNMSNELDEARFTFCTICFLFDSLTVPLDSASSRLFLIYEIQRV